MKSKIAQTIKNRKIQIVLMECLVGIGCIIALFVMTMTKYNLLDTTYSYSKVNTEVNEYNIEGTYMTRVMPLTEYETFKRIAATTLNQEFEENSYRVKVYSDENRTKEITSGYIASGMVVVAIPKDSDNVSKTETMKLKVNEKSENEIETEKKVQENTSLKNNEEGVITKSVEDEEEAIDITPQEIIEEEKAEEIAKESEEPINTTEEIAYTISVIGDFTSDGDINVTELTKIIKCVVGLNNWHFTEEERIAADLNNDGLIDIADVECCINYIVFGKLEVKEKEYTVTFKDYDGRVLSKKTDYHKGDTVEIPMNPTREADETYTYEFSGWNPEVSKTVTGNAEYIATYRAVANQSKYKVEHYKEKIDGTYELAETEELSEKTGKEVTAKAKEYTGFCEDTENEERTVNGTVLEDGSLTLKLFYNRSQYTLTLMKDENIERVSLNGENIETKNYKYGERVSINAILKQEIGYTMTFNKWVSSNTILIEDQIDKETTIEMPAGNIELKATANKTANEVSYNVEHYKEKLDGTYELAETEELTETTSKEVTAKAKEYIGFSEDTENEERKVSGIVSGDGSLTLKLFYKRNQYTVTFMDYNNTEISKIKYKYEEVINVPEDPTREADEIYTYEFLGWSPEVNEIAIEDVQYTAQYIETYIEYSIIFKNYDGTIISSKEEYHYGDTVEVPENPTREADDNYEYEFAGWDKEVTNVFKNEVYTATYHEIPYTILVKKADGRVEKYISFEKAFEAITDENITIQLIGDVTESVTIPEDKNVTLDLNNHKIISDQEATITNHATLLIVDNSIEKGGSIENTKNTAIVNNGDLTLGYDDGVVEDNILIKGQTKAIQNNETFHMYDGTLMGKNTIVGNNAIIPEGEEYGLSVREEDGIQIATIKIIEIPEALVGETYYKTLQQAIDENNNEIIYVVKKNVELVGSVTIDETKNLTIDLNGNNIESSSTTYVIENAGKLTITNTNESRVGSINSSKGKGIHNTANLKMKDINVNSVYNEKDLNIEDVNIESTIYNTHSSNDINFTMTRGSLSNIRNSKESNSIGNINVQITDATINGELDSSTNSSNTGNSKIMVEMINTTIKSKNYGIRVYGSNNKLILRDSKLDVENCYDGISLSGGPNEVLLENTQINMTSDDYNQNCEISCSGDYNLVIDKNTQITSTNTRGKVYAISANDSQNNNSSGHVKLIDGTISAIAKGDTRYYGGYGVYLNSGSFEFLGGNIQATTQTIDANIASVAEGKQIQTLQQEDKYISTLVDSQHTEYVASIGEEKYDSIKEAIAVCKNAEKANTITMLSDYEQWESLTISDQKNIILDLNGYKITAHSEFVNEGKFEITDTSTGQTGIIEEKTGRAILNKGNAIFTLSGGKILLNSTTLTKKAIYNTNQANINIKSGVLEIDNNKVSGSHYIIYNVSIGNIEITGGVLKGNIKTLGDLYGIYNFVDDTGGDRNINISGGCMELSSSNSSGICGIYNSTTHTSNITDISRDTININVSNYNISVKGSSWSTYYGICNTTGSGRDTIKVNLQNTIVDIANNYYTGSSSDSIRHL